MNELRPVCFNFLRKIMHSPLRRKYTTLSDKYRVLKDYPLKDNKKKNLLVVPLVTFIYESCIHRRVLRVFLAGRLKTHLYYHNIVTDRT